MLYGRDPERRAIGDLLDAARRARSGALVLRGEAGVGKTALLEDARDRATDMHVLAARGIEGESELPFAALHQLIRPALSHMEALPPPQARALAVALGMEEGADQERFLVYSACLSLLSELAEARPVLCLVDDAHWLDAPSGDALLFVARRLHAEGLVMLFSARDGAARPFVAAGVPSLNLAGLDAEAGGVLLDNVAGPTAPSVREHLVAYTQGNPLALVELPSVLSAPQLAGEEPLPDALPLTRQLEQVFHERVARLPEQTRRVLVVAAADDSEDVAVIVRAGERLGLDGYALDAAEAAGLVSLHGARVTFRHPLVRSAVYGAATSGERRDAHRALADALSDDGEHADRRAWHLAACVLGDDGTAVRALEDAARRAENRGAHGAAARALRRAADLARDDTARGALLTRAARDLGIAGRDEQAVALADQADALTAEPRARADLARVRVAAAIHRGRPADAVAGTLAAARALAPVDAAGTVDLLMHAGQAAWQGGDAGAFREIAALAATLDASRLDPSSRVVARSLEGFAAMVAGDVAAGSPLLEAALVWGAAATAPHEALWAAWAALWLGRERLFEELLLRVADLARGRGEVGTLADTLGIHAGQLAILSQRYEEAAVAAGEAIRLAAELDAENLLVVPHAALAVIAAVKGHDAEVRQHADRACDIARRNGLSLRASPAVHAMALQHMASARWEAALDLMETLVEGADPAAGIAAPDRVEAAVKAGFPDRARRALTFYESLVQASAQPAMRARLASCRLLMADAGDADDHIRDALDLVPHARPLDRARIRLLVGEHLRRDGRRRDAREQLRAAEEGFAALEAGPFLERTRRELRASGETARRRDDTLAPHLTPQERQIARLVANGLTNKEVAAQLFLSPRTIDAHLRGVFAKLGVTSRRELRHVPDLVVEPV